MSFAPPPGPPPPSVPEGWTSQFNDQYNRWFFINLATGKSQWEPPHATPPAAPPHSPPATGQAPPSYEESGPGDPSAVANAGDKKTPASLSSNNPYGHSSDHVGGPGSSGTPTTKSPNTLESDAELAARLQAEEDSRSRGGASTDYYQNASNPATASSPSLSGSGQERSRGSGKGGFFSKLMGKSSSGSGAGYSRPPPQSQYPPQQQQQYQQYPQQQQYGYPPQGAYPPQQGGYYPQGGPGYNPYGGYPPQQQGYYPQQPGMMQQQPQRRGGGGMGMAGAAALGVGGGLLGGVLLADALDDDHDDYGDGGDFGGDF